MPNDRQRVEEAVDQFKVQALNFGYEGIKNAAIREQYVREIKAMSDDMMRAYNRGLYSAEDAAKIAHQMRNQLLDGARAQQTPLGRSISKAMKEQGKAFEELMEQYAQRRFQRAFKHLDDVQKEEVFVDIVRASGRNRRAATSLTQRLKWGGRVFWLFTIGVSLYNIGTSENKVWATGREATTLGGGFAGGAAGGAVAGIWFGPIGIAVGVAVGGLLGALLAEETYLEAAGAERASANSFLDRHTTLFYTDETAIADMLVGEAGINMDQVYVVFLELDANYNGDADDVASLYIERVKKKGGSLLHALRLNKPLLNLLIRLLDEGWTTSGESRTIRYLEQLRDG